MNRLYLLAPALGMAAVLPGHAQQNLRTITGTVTSAADRTPLPGVTVLVKGTTTGTSTGADGRYTIQAAPGSTLTFSFIGYTTLERAIGDDSSINIGLKENTTQLNEVVVTTAYGIEQERREVNYGVQQVEGKELIDSRQTNVLGWRARRRRGHRHPGRHLPRRRQPAAVRHRRYYDGQQLLHRIDAAGRGLGL